jgi:hypothetical protein
VQKRNKKSLKKSDGDDDNSSEPFLNQNRPTGPKLIHSNSISNIYNEGFNQIDSSGSCSASSTLNPLAAASQPNTHFKLPKIVISQDGHQSKPNSNNNNSTEIELINHLKTQLDVYKSKEASYYNEKEKLAKVLDHYKKINQAKEFFQKLEILIVLKNENNYFQIFHP